MQESLDADRLLALVDDGIDPETFFIPRAKEYFGKQKLRQGVDYLLMAFGNCWHPSLHVHNDIVKDIERGWDEWSIAFRVYFDAHFRRPQRLI